MAELVGGVLPLVEDEEHDDLLRPRLVVVSDVLLDRQVAATDEGFVLCVAELGMVFQAVEGALDRRAIGGSMPRTPGAGV